LAISLPFFPPENDPVAVASVKEDGRISSTRQRFLQQLHCTRLSLTCEHCRVVAVLPTAMRLRHSRLPTRNSAMKIFDHDFFGVIYLTDLSHR
jgi:hypothetical protein